MRSYNPKDKYDVKEAAKLNAEPWMLAQLLKNPSYNCWGPGEDYMPVPDGSGSGWGSSLKFGCWKDNPFRPDDLNELVNFHFEVTRASKQCPDCMVGYAPQADALRATFYNGWSVCLTQDECDALSDEGRLERHFPGRYEWKKGKGTFLKSGFSHPTAAEVNALFGSRDHRGCLVFHDAINLGICLEARCKRLGHEYLCATCKGDSYIYTSETASLSLVMWFLHPRKGASRGVVVENIQESELPEVYKYLNDAAKRNAKRFAKVSKAFRSLSK